MKKLFLYSMSVVGILSALIFLGLLVEPTGKDNWEKTKIFEIRGANDAIAEIVHHKEKVRVTKALPYFTVNIRLPNSDNWNDRRQVYRAHSQPEIKWRSENNLVIKHYKGAVSQYSPVINLNDEEFRVTLDAYDAKL